MGDYSQTFLFLSIVAFLGTCLIAAFYEIERARIRWRERQSDKAKMIKLAAFRRR